MPTDHWTTANGYVAPLEGTRLSNEALRAAIDNLRDVSTSTGYSMNDVAQAFNNTWTRQYVVPNHWYWNDPEPVMFEIKYDNDEDEPPSLLDVNVDILGLFKLLEVNATIGCDNH